MADGGSEVVSNPARASMRYAKWPAAWSELPRATVTHAASRIAAMRRASESIEGPDSASKRAIASGAARVSASISDVAGTGVVKSVVAMDTEAFGDDIMKAQVTVEYDQIGKCARYQPATLIGANIVGGQGRRP